MTITYTTETASEALANTDTLEDAQTLMQQISTATGWPIIEGCLIPTPGTWHANDGNAEITGEFESGEEAAQDYVDGGDWGDDNETTSWVTVRVWREGIDVNGDTARVDEATHKIEIEPKEPGCTGEHEHDWRAPLSIVGGCKENPGVFGSGGGVAIHEVCIRCGCEKVTDTWAQDRSDGEQGLTSVEFERGKYADKVQEWLEKRVSFEADGSGVAATLDIGDETYTARYETADDEGYRSDRDEWPGPGEWPEPPAAMIDEARAELEHAG